MKIAIIYGPFCLGSPDRVFDLSRLWTDDRGLTGSELAYFRIAKEMSLRGHEVVLFTFTKDDLPTTWEGLEVRHYGDLNAVDSGWDVALAWNEPEALREVTPDVLRAVNLQINSFTHCLPGFHEHVDFWTSPSAAHRDMILGRQHPVGTDKMVRDVWYRADPGDWEVLTNGTDAHMYDELLGSGIRKVPGRVIWASSPDRGLHWLLQAWPAIRRGAPHAHLRIFYRIQKWLDDFRDMPPTDDLTIEEQRSRAHYIREALRRLDGHGIEVMHSVSRERIAREMAEAQVLAYSCDTVSWTEGFSVTLMEACAAATVPVTTDVDALGSIYGSLPTVVRSPVGERLGELADLVVRSLNSDEFRNEAVRIGRDIAERHLWKDIAGTLEGMLEDRLIRKRGG